MKYSLTLIISLVFLPCLCLHAAERASERKAEASAAKSAKAQRSGFEGPAGKRYTYKSSAGKEREMEVFFPPSHDPSKAALPGLILFHGGGWTGGTLAQFRQACAYFASRGLVCSTAEYRMLSKSEARQRAARESHKRVCITDAKSAIRWFKKKAPEFGVDPNRIITGGGSAGGHISALATLNPGLNDPADPTDVDTRVVAYLWFNPAFSPEDQQDPEVNVVPFLSKNVPPAIAFFGTEDPWKRGWDIAWARLQEVGNTTADFQLAAGQTHSFFNKGPWQIVTLIAADRFLVSLGLLTGEPTLAPPPTGEKLQPALPTQ